MEIELSENPIRLNARFGPELRNQTLNNFGLPFSKSTMLMSKHFSSILDVSTAGEKISTPRTVTPIQGY
jgi:hypothetical protein